MFHALPPSAGSEAATSWPVRPPAPAPQATHRRADGPWRRSRFPHRLRRPRPIRDELADHFHGLLGAQDRAAGGRTSPSRTRCPCGSDALLVELEARFPRRGRSASAGWRCTAISAGRGRRWHAAHSAALARSPIPSQLSSNAARPASSTEASIGMSSSSSIGPFRSWRSPSPPPSPRPSRRHHRFPRRPSRRPAPRPAGPRPRSLEDRLQFFLDAFVDGVVEDRQRSLVLVVDIVRRLAAVIIGRRLRLIFARPQDDPAKRVERGQRVHQSASIPRLTRAAGDGSSR